MIVYHGSTEIIKNPDVVHSKRYLDFGRGFYITTFENQAKKCERHWGVCPSKEEINISKKIINKTGSGTSLRPHCS